MFPVKAERKTDGLLGVGEAVGSAEAAQGWGWRYASGEGRLARGWHGSEAALLRSSLRAKLTAQHEPCDVIDRAGAAASLE